MKTEVIISIVAVVVVLAIIAYVVHNKDTFTPTPTQPVIPEGEVINPHYDDLQVGFIDL